MSFVCFSTIFMANIMLQHITPILQYIACWVGARCIAPFVRALHSITIKTDRTHLAINRSPTYGDQSRYHLQHEHNMYLVEA
jgi:hypothetical protein